MPLLPDTGYTPTQDELASVEAWFAAYDAHSAERDIARMADLAVFPLNLVSDNAAGDGASAQWDREQFIGTMTQVMGEGADGDLSFDSVRTPVFLTSAMAVVFTDSTMTTATGETQQLRYADVLIKRNGEWAFQTMIQGGWGDNLS
ncbi:nuclear transport factor 2 family protein [Streptomyces sp. NPDC058595]|uniref:nuclear transport factor 2 family protein n=1 Tax=Streptomyces sp. NPDC058595 TaxID=3346550 RepID=UPI00365354B8